VSWLLMDAGMLAAYAVIRKRKLSAAV